MREDDLNDRNAPDSTNILFWRKRILNTSLPFGAAFAVVAFVPSAFLLIHEKRFFLLGLATFLLAMVFMVWSASRLKYEIRAAIAVALLYFMGLGIILFRGPFTGGPVWIFLFGISAGVFLGLRAGIWALILNGLTLIVIGVFVRSGYLTWDVSMTSPSANWAIAGILFIALNAMGIVTVAALIDGLNTTLEKEKNSRASTEAEMQRRLKLEKAFSESEKRYRMLFENAGDAIFIVNAESPDAGRIVQANRAAAQMHGYTVAELIGRPIADLDAPDAATGAPQKIHQILQQEWIYTEIDHIKKDGTVFPVEVSAGLVEIGEERYVLEFDRDISDRKRVEAEKERLESQIRQAGKMEAIGTLAGGIAHDFNNLLAAILGFTELSLEEVPSDSLVHANLSRVHEASLRAKELVKQILDYSRQSGSQKKPVRVDLLIKEVIKLHRPLMPPNIEVKMHLEPVRPIIADLNQMHQVVTNICANAWHAMEDSGGVLTVMLTDVEIDRSFCDRHPELKPGSYVELSITDTGPGMTKAVMERIFDPFYTTKTKDKGTGMGLSVAHGIVQSHAGTIIAESRPKAGAIFRVLLPAAVSPIEPAGLPAVGRMKKGTETILFVDDEKMQVEIACESLGRLGYTVIGHTRSTEAMADFRKNPERFDLVITDITMPDISGDRFSKQLRAIRPDIPIIVCTGYSNQFKEEDARAIGVQGYLFKPLIIREIADTIRNVLDRGDG